MTSLQQQKMRQIMKLFFEILFLSCPCFGRFGHHRELEGSHIRIGVDAASLLPILVLSISVDYNTWIYITYN